MDYQELKEQQKRTEQSTRLVYDMKEEMMKITRAVLNRLTNTDLERLANLFHPLHGQSNISRSEFMQKEDEIGRVISLVKIELNR
jgi:hypothetical protein